MCWSSKNVKVYKYFMLIFCAYTTNLENNVPVTCGILICFLGSCAFQRLSLRRDLQHRPAAAWQGTQLQLADQPLLPRVIHHLSPSPTGWELPPRCWHVGPGLSMINRWLQEIRYGKHVIIFGIFPIYFVIEQIKLWDIRVKRCVRQYEGHDNKYAFLPIHVNEPEDLLLAGTALSC